MQDGPPAGASCLAPRWLPASQVDRRLGHRPKAQHAHVAGLVCPQLDRIQCAVSSVQSPVSQQLPVVFWVIRIRRCRGTHTSCRTHPTWESTTQVAGGGERQDLVGALAVHLLPGHTTCSSRVQCPVLTFAEVVLVSAGAPRMGAHNKNCQKHVWNFDDYEKCENSSMVM